MRYINRKVNWKNEYGFSFECYISEKSHITQFTVSYTHLDVYKRQIYSVGGTPIFDFDDVERIIDAYNDGVNEFFNYDTDNAYLEDLDCEEVY